jgi:signal transduction histidine kinase
VLRGHEHAAQAVSSGIEAWTRIAAMSLSQHLPRVLDAMFFARPIRGALEDLIEFLASAYQRAHPSREGSIGRLASGLRQRIRTPLARPRVARNEEAA